AAGHDVHFIPVFLRNFYPDATPEDRKTAAPEELYPRIRNAGQREDLHLVSELGLQSDLACAVVDELAKRSPQVILLEQPWLFGLVEHALENMPALAQTALVYSSQNVES